jgi:thiol:disulfide interchange protein DsbD
MAFFQAAVLGLRRIASQPASLMVTIALSAPLSMESIMFKKQILLSLAFAVFSLGMHQHSLAQQSSAPGLQKRLSDLLGNSKEDELLEPEQAFKLKVIFTGPTTLVAELVPANGYYMYRDRIRFAIKNSRGVSIKEVKLPAGKIKQDLTFGTTETYDKPIQAAITLTRAPGAKDFTLAATYQGCHEKTGVCYPPIDTTLNLALP